MAIALVIDEYNYTTTKDIQESNLPIINFITDHFNFFTPKKKRLPG